MRLEKLSRPKALPLIPGGVRLGIFQPNQANLFHTTAKPGHTPGTYEANRRVIQLADELGLSFSLTVARWRRVKGEAVDWAAYGLETFALTAAMLEATRQITIFTTCHAGLWNPGMVAKMGATLDHIGSGRWGLNIVAGWNEPEFVGLGSKLLEHEERYAFATHWLAAVRELWLTGQSSYSCPYFQLREAECRPRPLQAGGPVVVNAGSSPSGMQFAMNNADYLFSDDGEGAERFREAGGTDRKLGYIASAAVLVAKTTPEAEELRDDIMRQYDTVALANSPSRRASAQRALVGSPDQIGKRLAEWCARTAADAICLILFDYERDLEMLARGSFEVLGNELAAHGKRLILETTKV